MKRKLVMVLLTATLVGSMMTGCGSKAKPRLPLKKRRQKKQRRQMLKKLRKQR